VAITASLALVVGLASAGFAVQWLSLRDEGTKDFDPTQPRGATASPALETGKCADHPCNYLLLGSDSRAGLDPEKYGTNEDIGGENRADTIMLVHTDPALEKAIVLSFPRDLWVEIPGRGSDRINAAFEGGVGGGGPQLMAQTVSNLTGLRIDHFLYVDLLGFQRVVETLGGVDMCIPAYNVNTPGWVTAGSPTGEDVQVYIDAPGRIVDPKAGLDIEPGCQQLDGTQALAYVRARHLPCDAIPDFSRIGRQQQFLRSLINRMLQPSQLVQAPRLVSPILRSLQRDRDFLPADLVYLVGQLQGLTTGAVEFRAVPGFSAWEGTKSVVQMDPSADRLFEAIKDGRPISGVGTQLVNTPPSEANTTVAVVDANATDVAEEALAILSQAGFDVSPGVVPATQAPAGLQAPAIVFQPGQSSYAQVVGAYFPGLELVESAQLRGAPVAVVVAPSYDPSPPSQGSAGPDGACPDVAA
jgi:anionic cell wall polymer biosynthesis LytR-Cps2A-Psr (LCP) family protein